MLVNKLAEGAEVPVCDPFVTGDVLPAVGDVIITTSDVKDVVVCERLLRFWFNNCSSQQNSPSSILL